MLSQIQINNITVLVQSIRPVWDTRAIRPVIEDLSNAGLDITMITNAAVVTAADSMYRHPAAIRRVIDGIIQDGEIGDHAIEHNPITCDVCGRSQKMCLKAQQGQLKIFNDVRARHPSTGPIGCDPRHDFVPHVERPDTIMGDERRVLIEQLKRRFPKTSISDVLPYVPEDLLGDAVAGRATGDDQEAGESAP
jgi:hypothetical protein